MADCLTDEDRALIGQLLDRELAEIKNTPQLAGRREAVEALIKDVPKMTMCAPTAAKTRQVRSTDSSKGDGNTAVATADVDVFVDTSDAEVVSAPARKAKGARAKGPRALFMSYCMRGKEKGGLEKTLKECSALYKKQKAAAPAATPNGAPEVVLVDGNRSPSVASRAPPAMGAPAPFAEPHPEFMGG